MTNDDWQVRKDIDRLKWILGGYENLFSDKGSVQSLADLLQNNYYDKSEVYSKEEIAGIVTGNIGLELSDYVTKTDLIDNTKYGVDLDLTFGVRGMQDKIIVDMDIVNYMVSKTMDIGDVNDGN